MSRASFLRAIQKLGFQDYQPKGEIHKYFPREFFKLDDRIVAISDKGKEIEITVYHNQSIARFDNYRQALNHLVSSDDNLEQEESTNIKKVRRSKKS